MVNIFYFYNGVVQGDNFGNRMIGKDQFVANPKMSQYMIDINDPKTYPPQIWMNNSAKKPTSQGLLVKSSIWFCYPLNLDVGLQ